MSPIGRACPVAGCGRTIPRDASRCAVHAAELADRERARQRDVDARRPRGFERSLYATPEWRAQSRSFLADRPWCECAECLEVERHGGARLRATVVDHVIPHRGHPGLFWDRRNWRPMAGRCHSRKTARDDGGFGNARRVTK